MTDIKEGLLQDVSKFRTQIMGFAAMWIFIFHVRNEILVFRGVPVLCDLEIFFANIGFTGVDIFLFLSGWGLINAIRKHNLLDFYKRRYRRLVFPFVLACLVPALYYKWELLRFIRAVTGWTFLTKNIFEQAWFIPAIAILYLFFPLYHKFFEKASNKYIFTAVMIAVWFVFALAGTNLSGRTDYYVFINRIPVFLVGILFGWMDNSKKKIPEVAAWIVIPVMLISGFQILYYTAFQKINIILPQESGLPALLVGIAMCFVFARIFSLLSKVTFIQKAFGFLGKRSLEFYIMQEILIYILQEELLYAGVPFNKHLFVLIVFLFCLGGAYLTHLLFTTITDKLDGKSVFAVNEKA